MRNALFILLLPVIFFSCSTQEEQLFTAVPKEHSQVYFENRIVENEQYNVYDYHNLYNGGGIAVIDINNDGLQDLYFTGNQVSDKLYLNKGDFVFEDISERAGVIRNDWSTGVSVVDINADGFLDLYVCKSGNESVENRGNKLFINNGDLTFREEAAERGLADTTHSDHAAFFDFDKDGDMDMYLLTTSNRIRNPNILREKDKYGLYARDRLYVNDGTGHFTEEGLKRGIDQNNHGLGLAVADINGDGWEDVLASSDFLPNDVVYMNNQDGTFSVKTSEILPYQSRFSMGNDIADVNNDGLPDIMTVDMLPSTNEQQKKMLMTSYHVFETEGQLGYQPEFTRNMFFLNEGIKDGLPRFSEMGMYMGVANTDWSWAPLMIDFDNDGLKDIAVSNGYLRDVTDSDYVSYNMSFAQKTKSAEELRAYMNENTANLPQLKARNRFFKQTGDFRFVDVTEKWVSEAQGFANGAVFADLDNDGDEDFIVNNINQPASILKNNSKNNYLKIKLKGRSNNPIAQGARIEITSDGKTQTWFQNLSRGYQSSVDPSVIFGLGNVKKVDKILVFWPMGGVSKLNDISVNQVLMVDEEKSVPYATPSSQTTGNTLFHQLEVSVKHTEKRFIDYYRENLLLQKYSMVGPALAVADINGDHFDEFYLGGNKDWPGQLRHISPEKIEGVDLDCKGGEDADAVFFDANGDGHNDLYLVRGGTELPVPDAIYQDQLYLNDGKGGLQPADILPNLDFPGSAALAFDFDGDGDIDVLRGGGVKPGKFPYSEKSVLLINNKGRFDIGWQGDLGMVSDLLEVEMKGQKVIVAVGHYRSPLILRKNRNEFIIEEINPELKGLWNTIAKADLDGDGDEDLILGNIGRNYRYPFSSNEPLSVYGSSKFGGFLVTCFEDGVEVPVATRDDLVRQFPAIRSKFPNYESYAKAKFSDMKELFETLLVRADEMKSMILWNEGATFKPEALPEPAQRFPIKAVLAEDFNKDGLPDLLLAGNSNYTEPTNTGFIQGSMGLVLLNQGNGEFKALTNTESGVWLSGQTNHLKLVKTKKGNEIIAARNNDSVIILNYKY